MKSGPDGLWALRCNRQPLGGAGESGVRIRRLLSQSDEDEGRRDGSRPLRQDFHAHPRSPVWREAGDHLLEEADVKVLFHTTVVDVLNDGECVEGVVAWTKQGRLDIQAGITIDASGDADVAALAGLETFVGRDGSVQNPTMIFRLIGVDVARFLTRYGEDSILGDEVSQMIRNLHNSREYDLPRAKVFMFPTPRPNELLCNCTRIIGRDGRELNPLWVEDITEAEIQGRRQAREYARFFKDHLVGCENAFINDTGVQIGVRQTRQIRGVGILTNDDVVSGAKRKDFDRTLGLADRASYRRKAASGVAT